METAERWRYYADCLDANDYIDGASTLADDIRRNVGDDPNDAQISLDLCAEEWDLIRRTRDADPGPTEEA